MQSAVLLICAILEEEQLKKFIFKLVKELGLSALVEAHDEKRELNKKFV